MLPAAVAGLIFLGMAVLYVTGRRTISDQILRAWGVDPYAFPFLDAEGVLSALRCVRAGVDVFAANPCDPLHRVFNYSPLWLLLARLPVTQAWLMPAGLVVGLAFTTSMALLPPGRGAVETGLIMLGVLSSAVVFAVERGNNDLVIFVLATVAVALACRAPALRLVAYAAALLAGFLKFYPMTLLAMATRERPRPFVAVAAASLAATTLFVATMGHDVARAVPHIPVGQSFGDMLGSSILPGGLAKLFGWPSGVATALRVALALAALGTGVALGRRQAVMGALDRLTDAERMALLAGGLLILGCFFTVQNVGYRAIHLVLTVPALTALARLGAGRLWSATTCAVLALLWSQGWRNWISGVIDGRAAIVGGWLLREALWWWTITMMIAIVLSLLARSEMGQWLRDATRGSRARPPMPTRSSRTRVREARS